MKSIVTTYENKVVRTIEKQIDFVPDAINVEGEVINLYPQMTFQKVIGFGGAFTEAFGYTLSKASIEVQQQVINDYFGENGLHYNYCRTHLDSCDFSLSNYSAINDESDVKMESFSLARDQQYILPYIQMAQKASEEPISFMLSPWSPPAFMKSNGQKNRGGKLLPKYYSFWARYIAKYIASYREMAVDVKCITVQNEANATQPWDSCVYTSADELVFVRDFLGPALESFGVADVDVLIWDHNKERIFERAEDVFSDQAVNQYATGIAFHWYSGDHFDAVQLVSKRYPDKLLMMSEGAFEYIHGEEIDQLNHAQIYAHQMIGNFNAGMHASFDWNLALDESGGPNHVGNWAVAPMMYNAKAKQFDKQLSYYYIGHFSRYIHKGAQRIGSSCYSEKLEVSAFINPNHTIVAVILNRTAETLVYNLRVAGKLAENVVCPKQSITTLVL